MIGFIGLGVMGGPMARNLLDGGYPLVVHTRTRAKADDLLSRGARWANDVRAVAAQSDVVITMLPDSPDVEKISAEIFAGARHGAVWIDMSTIAPRVARKLAADAGARDVDFLDAPVSGGETGAISATLSIMVGGTVTAFERALPIFQKLGKNIVHVGDPGAGQVAKAANQVIVALTIGAVGEALTLAARAGVDPAKVRQALLGGFAQSRVLDAHGQRMLERNFKPGFRLQLHHKDLGIALDAGKDSGVELRLTEGVRAMMAELIARGEGELDHSSLVKWFEGQAR